MNITKKRIFVIGLLSFMCVTVILSISWVSQFLHNPDVKDFLETLKWDEYRIHKTIDSGNEIVSALYAFQKDIGTFPESLDELVPKYLEKIPFPSVPNYIWEYEHFMSDGKYEVYEKSDTKHGNAVDTFRLVVSCGRHHYPLIQYSSNDKDWYVDQ